MGEVPASSRTARVGAELAPPREPRDDHAGEHAEHHLRDHHGDRSSRCPRRARSLPAMALSTSSPMTRARKITKVFTTPWISVSVTMSPLATCADFVAQHRFDFVATHAAQQAGADGDQRVIAAGAGGEGVGIGRIEDADFGHADAGLSAWRRTVLTSHCSASLRGC